MTLQYCSSLHLLLLPSSLMNTTVVDRRCLMFPKGIIYFSCRTNTQKYFQPIVNNQPKHHTMDSTLQPQPRNALLQQQLPPPPRPRDIGKSDLLARLSDFLPRMSAANALLSDNAVDHHPAILDGGLQMVNDTDESSSRSSSSDSDDDDEEDEIPNVGSGSHDDKQGPERDSESDAGEFERPHKQVKLSKRHRTPTVVLSLQLTPENNPLFQALHQDDASCRGVDQAATADSNTDGPVTEEHTQEELWQNSSGVDGTTASIQRLLALPAIQNKPATSLEQPRGPLITEL
jgi:hypothetical protein